MVGIRAHIKDYSCQKMEFFDFKDFTFLVPIDLDTPGASFHINKINYQKFKGAF